MLFDRLSGLANETLLKLVSKLNSVHFATKSSRSHENNCWYIRTKLLTKFGANDTVSVFILVVVFRRF